MVGFHRRHSSNNNGNSLNAKDPPLLLNGNIDMDKAGIFGSESCHSETMCLKKNHRLRANNNIADIEAGINGDEEEHLVCCCGCSKKDGRQKLLKGSLQTHQRLPRLVDKEGNCLIRPKNIPNPIFNIIRNWFHLVIETSWRAILVIFAAGYVFSWLGFGFLYYLIAYYSGDLDEIRFSKNAVIAGWQFDAEEENKRADNLSVCSSTTVSSSCSSRSKKEFPTLMIRLADVQHRLYLAESHVRLYMAHTKINCNGQKELLGVKDMNVGYDTGTDRVLLLWPIIVRHTMDEDSPFYGMTPEKMQGATDFELIMTVEGIVEATGMTFQARSSFLPDEIQWGKKFQPIVMLNTSTNQYEVDYDLFDRLEEAPLCVLEKQINQHKAHPHDTLLTNRQSFRERTHSEKHKIFTVNELTVSTNAAPHSSFDEDEAITPGTNQDEPGNEERPLIRLSSNDHHHYHHSHTHQHHHALASGFT